MITERDMVFTYHHETFQHVPAHTLESLVRYRDNGTPTGGFLAAFLSNNLMGAIGRADLENLRNLAAIGYFVYNAMPAESWGSEERVDAWIKKKIEEGT